MGSQNRCREGIGSDKWHGFGCVVSAGPVLFTGRFAVVTAAATRSGQIWLRLSSRTTGSHQSVTLMGARLSDRRCSAELVGRKVRPALLLVVWALKREVRAIRGCLGAYRR